MTTKLFGLFTAFLVSCGFVGFVYWSPIFSHITVSEEKNIQYWSDSGEFIYTGGIISSFSGSDFFSSGISAIDEIKILQSEPISEPRFYIEYPNFREIQNLSILSGIRNRILTLSTDDKLSYNSASGSDNSHTKAFGYDAHFTVSSGNNFGSIIYDIHKHNANGQIENAIKKIFLVTASGNTITPVDIVHSDDLEARAQFIDAITKKILENFPQKVLFSAESIEQNLVSYLQDPQFSFSGSNVHFYIQSEIFSNDRNKTSEIILDYNLISRLFLSEPKSLIAEKNNKNLNKQTGKSADGKKYVALTFDDGPHKTYTTWLLDSLKAKGVPATFFMLGKNIAGKENILQRMVEEKHELAGHSWDHTSFVKISNQAIRKQMQKTNNAIYEATGVRAKLFRPPYGAYNNNTLKNIDAPIIMWSVDSRDWKNRNINANIKTTLSQVHDGAIILFHDIHKESVESIPALIDALRQEGYEFLTVSELYAKYYNSEILLPEQVCFSMKKC